MATVTAIPEFSKVDFDRLARIQEKALLSFSIPNAGSAQLSLDHSPAALKSLLDRAQELLSVRGLNAHAIDDFLAPVRSFFANSELWTGHEASVLIFRGHDSFYTFVTPLKLEPGVFAGSRFHLKSLVLCSTQTGRYYVLSLSENAARLFCRENGHFDEIRVDALPTSLAEALQEKSFSVSLQAHSSGAKTHGLTYHAHSEPVEEAHRNRLLYCERINTALHEVLGRPGDPLILACVKEFVPIFQKANTYPNLLPDAILGNPDRTPTDELQKAAQQILDLKSQKEAEAAMAKYSAVLDSGRRTNNLLDILRAAHRGRIEEALVATDTGIWGTFEPGSESLHISAAAKNAMAEDLLNLITVETVAHGGVVHALHSAALPEGSLAAAILRY